MMPLEESAAVFLSSLDPRLVADAVLPIGGSPAVVHSQHILPAFGAQRPANRRRVHREDEEERELQVLNTNSRLKALSPRRI